MADNMPNELKPDPELGRALLAAPAQPHDGAFVTRVRARVRAQQRRTWDEILAGWFWQGVLAASIAAVASVVLWRATAQPVLVARPMIESVASQLIDGQQPGTDIILASLAGIR